MADGLLPLPQVAVGVWQNLHEALRAAERRRAGRSAGASVAVVDSRSVRIAEESGGIKGFDAGKNVPVRK